MREIKLRGLDTTCYKEVLDDGLEVYLVPYENKKNYFMAYATRYGADVSSFIPTDSKKEVKLPDGIAHFLEHKMFEQEDGIDPFTYFSKSGTGANAYTSYDRTVYICYGTKDFIPNLKFLMNYVNSPYYTDENVEKEKGIIAEELKMYLDMPDWQMETKLREAVYNTHPRRIDVGGSVEEIQKITKEQLYSCYNNFYSPSNMFLLLVGNFKVDEALNTIKIDMAGVANRGKGTVKKVNEAKKVKAHNKTITGNVEVPKVGVGLKVAVEDLGKYDNLTLDLYLELFTSIVFGSSSQFRERLRNKKLLNNISSYWEDIPGYKTFFLVVSTDDPNAYIEEFKEEINNIKLDEESFNRMKKVWIANEVKTFDNVDSVASYLTDDLVTYGKVISNKLDLIKRLDLKELKKIVNKIDFTNISIVKYLKEEEEDII